RRPIPSGRVSRRAAFALAALCFGGSLALAAAGGSLGIAAALLAMIVLYDAAVKATPIGPAAMAGCRALNAGLGSAAGTLAAPTIAPAVVLFGYVLILTVVSRFEVIAAPARVVNGAAIALTAVLATSAAIMLSSWPPRAGAGIAFLALLALWLAPAVRAALAEPSPPRIIGVVKACVLGIVLLDAAFVAAARGPLAGLAVATALVPAYLLGRRFASA